MHKLAIGMPIYNGEDQLESCLSCIFDQSFDDFSVLLFDNCSTDRTAEIVNDLAATEPRLRYFRNDKNVGSGQNFLNTLEAADSKYFAWRADDDLSSNDYFSLLVDSLDHQPNAALAVGRVERHISSIRVPRHFPFVSDIRGPSLTNILRKMFLCNPCWFYGVWLTERLRSYCKFAWQHYPTVFGRDDIIVLNAVLDNAVTGDERALFVQRLGVRIRDSEGKQGKASYSERIRWLREGNDLRPMFLSSCLSSVRARNWTRNERVILELAVRRFSRKRVGTSGLRMMSLQMRRILFES